MDPQQTGGVSPAPPVAPAASPGSESAAAGAAASPAPSTSTATPTKQNEDERQTPHATHTIHQHQQAHEPARLRGGSYDASSVYGVPSDRAESHLPLGFKLFIGCLPSSAKEDDLRRAFEPFGVIVDAVVLKDKFTRASKGCGFVVFRDQASADRAIDELHDQFVLPDSTRALIVRYAGRRPDDTNKLYVSMLSTHTTEDELYARFIPFGSISEVVILREKDDAGTSKGCAFVKFLTAEAAQAAILALDKQVRDKQSDQLMNVRFAHTHDEKMQYQRRNASRATDPVYMHGNSASGGLASAATAASYAPHAPPLHESLIHQLNQQQRAGNALLQTLLQQQQQHQLQQDRDRSFRSSEAQYRPQAQSTSQAPQLHQPRLVQPDPYRRPADAIHSPGGAPPSDALQRLLSQLSVSVGGNPAYSGLPESIGSRSPEHTGYGHPMYTNGATPTPTVPPVPIMPFSFASTPGASQTTTFLPASSYPPAALSGQAHHVPYPAQPTFGAPFSNPALAPAASSSVRGHRRKTDPRGPEGCNLFVHNLPPSFTEEDLLKLFRPFGLVLSVKIQRERMSTLSRGFGFVSYCLAASSRLPLHGGPDVAISAVQVGDRVVGAAGEAVLVTGKATGVADTMWRIRYRGGEHLVTDNHLVTMVWRGSSGASLRTPGLGPTIQIRPEPTASAAHQLCAQARWIDRSSLAPHHLSFRFTLPDMVTPKSDLLASTPKEEEGTAVGDPARSLVLPASLNTRDLVREFLARCLFVLEGEELIAPIYSGDLFDVRADELAAFLAHHQDAVALPIVRTRPPRDQVKSVAISALPATASPAVPCADSVAHPLRGEAAQRKESAASDGEDSLAPPSPVDPVDLYLRCEEILAEFMVEKGLAVGAASLASTVCALPALPAVDLATSRKVCLSFDPSVARSTNEPAVAGESISFVPVQLGDRVDIVYLIHNSLVDHSMAANADAECAHTIRQLERAWKIVGIDVAQANIMLTELNPGAGVAGEMEAIPAQSDAVWLASMAAALSVRPKCILAFGSSERHRWMQAYREHSLPVDSVRLVTSEDDCQSLELHYGGHTAQVMFAAHPSFWYQFDTVVAAVARAHGVPLSARLLGEVSKLETHVPIDDVARVAGGSYVGLTVEGGRFVLSDGVLTHNSNHHAAQLAIAHLNETTIGGKQILVRVKGADYERRDQQVQASHQSNNSHNSGHTHNSHGAALGSNNSSLAQTTTQTNVAMYQQQHQQHQQHQQQHQQHQLQQRQQQHQQQRFHHQLANDYLSTAASSSGASASLSPLQPSLSSFYASMMGAGGPSTAAYNAPSPQQAQQQQQSHAQMTPTGNTPTIEQLMQQAIFLSQLQQQQQAPSPPQSMSQLSQLHPSLQSNPTANPHSFNYPTF